MASFSNIPQLEETENDNSNKHDEGKTADNRNS